MNFAKILLIAIFQHKDQPLQLRPQQREIMAKAILRQKQLNTLS